MPLTEKGFQRLTYDEILEIQIERSKLLFGDDIDTSENSTFGKILRLYCLDAAENQEIAEKIYFSAFPNTANGISLDRLCSFAGISRNPATYAQHEIEITGTAGETVEMGFLVSAGDVVFHTVDNYIIGDTGTVTAIVECNDVGIIGNVGVGSIDNIVNPTANVSSITHIAVVNAAEEIETDYKLRERFSQAISGAGSGTLEGIKGALLRVPGIETVLIKENTTFHRFECVILSDSSVSEQVIAQTIFDNKPIGISAVGDIKVTLRDSNGLEHLIGYSTTKIVNTYVKCSISVDANYSDESLQTIKDNIVSKLAKYTNGQDVTVTSLYSEIYVNGVTDVTALAISSDGVTYGATAISVDENSVARTDLSKIEVSLNE